MLLTSCAHKYGQATLFSGPSLLVRKKKRSPGRGRGSQLLKLKCAKYGRICSKCGLAVPDPVVLEKWLIYRAKKCNVKSDFKGLSK